MEQSILNYTGVLGPNQKKMLTTLRANPGPHYVVGDYRTMRVVRSLASRKLIHMTSCGECDAKGRSIYRIQAA